MCTTFLNDDFVYKKDTFQETSFLKKILKIMFIGELKVKT